MTATAELEQREKEIKDQLDQAEGLDERKALRSELREIRRKLFDVPAAPIITAKTTIEKPAVKQQFEDKSKMNSRSRVQKVDTNNNNEAELHKATSKSSSSVSLTTTLKSTTAPSSEYGGMNKTNIRTSRRDRFEEKQTAVVNNVGGNSSNNPTVSLTMNGQQKQQQEPADSKVKTVRMSTSTNGNIGKVELNKTDTEPPSWAQKNKNRGLGASKFGAQVGQSPFQFAINYNARKSTSPAHSDTDRPKYTGYNKYTPSIKKNVTPTTALSDTLPEQQHLVNDTSTSSPAHSSNNDNAAHNTNNNDTSRRPSASKYITSYQSKRDEKNNTAQLPLSRAKSLAETGTSYLPKSPPSPSSSSSTASRDLINKFERTNSEKIIPSYNKYVSPVRRTDSSSSSKTQAANNILRSVSMRVRPTYETSSSSSSTLPQPSVDFSRKYRQNDSQSTESATPLNDKQTTSAKTTPSYMSKRLSSASSARTAVSPSSPPPKPPPEPTPPAEPAANPLAAFGSGNAIDRMAFFRQAAQQEKDAADKKEKKREERRQQLEAMTALVNGQIQQEHEVENSTNKNEADNSNKAEEKVQTSPKKRSTAKKEVPDSEKMKNASAPCMKKREKKKVVRRTMSIGSIVLDWVQEMISDYPVKVTNFSSSWNDGLAFCALIHKFNPDEFDFSELKSENKRYNFDLAFNTGKKVKDIPILLDTEDMVAMPKPEPRSVQTYIQWVWSVYGPTSGYGPTPKEVQN